jgi:transposase
LPKHLPREEVVVDLADKSCPCCGGLRVKIGEDVSERLDMIPARFKVIVTRRPKYACRDCDGEVAQAPAPEHLIEGGIPTENLIAAVVISKYADHLPLYRQSQIYGRQGVDLDRSTLADWSGRAAFALRPLHERLFEVLKGSDKLFADETRAPVLDPGRGKTKTGQLWAYARDDRPWGGPEPPGVVYVYEPDRKHERPAAHLAGFAGILQVDGYGAYKALAEGNAVTLGFCWAHARRKFFDIQAANPAPIAAEALARIGALYAIERDIRGSSAPIRQAARQARAKPIMEAMKPWLEAKLGAVSGKSTIAEAIRYALSRWAGLNRYLHDGRIEIDSNVVERGMRIIALGRKNHLFAGSDDGARFWAIHASLIETCKMNDVDPQAWLADVLDKIANRHPMSRIDDLLPWTYIREGAERQVA